MVNFINIQVEAVKELRSTSYEFTNKETTNNCYELELAFEANSKSEIDSPSR